MAIVGEKLKDYVVNQINQRQKGLGDITKTDENLAYFNAKTAWVKLASSVYIDPEEKGEKRLQEINLPYDFKGTTLAREYILFNGIGRKGDRAGIVSPNNPNGAYGIGGTEFGYSPMPGIIDANIESLNRGSIKKSTIANRLQYI